MTGLAGTGLSMIVLGLAPNFYIAILARALGGMLNGNVGVLQTTVTELVTVKEHQPLAYTVMPFVWGLGSIAGPVLGGILAEPVKNYPKYFSDDTIWEHFPFLLVNLLCAFVACCSVTVAWLFLEETHPVRKHDKDYGTELGERILACFGASPPPGYETIEQLPYSSPILRQTPSSSLLAPDLFDPNESVIPKKAFTKQVLLNIAAYGIFAYHTITFDQLLPVMLSTPDFASPDNAKLGGQHITLPFKFLCGFGLSTSSIGIILMSQGLFSIFSTLLFFLFLAKKIGALDLFRGLAFSYPVLYFTAPYILLMPEPVRTIAVVSLLVWKCTWSTCSLTASAIFLANSAPSLMMLGVINGAAASAASLNRALGPTVAGFVYCKSQTWGYAGLCGWCAAIVASAGVVLSLYLNDNNNRDDMKNDVVDEESIEEECSEETCKIRPKGMTVIVTALKTRQRRHDTTTYAVPVFLDGSGGSFRSARITTSSDHPPLSSQSFC